MSLHPTSRQAEAAPVVKQLVDLIQVLPSAGDRFVGQSADIGTPSVFGGQVLGQALMAASLTVPPGRTVHSFHAYFLLPGRHEPIDYAVEHVRDGRSFSTRHVQARQQGEAIFELSASYQLPEDALDSHDPMPRVPGPEGIASEADYHRSMIDRLPTSLREKSILDRKSHV